jgi:glycosyltransferase involved in cell wall biosynthesis
LRICFVTPEFPPAIGGLGQSVSRVARGLAEHTDHEIHVLWVDTWKDHDWHLREHVASTHPAGTAAGGRAPKIHYVEPAPSELVSPKLAYFRHLGRLVSTLHFDVLVGVGLTWAGFPTTLLGRELGVRTVVSMHGGEHEYHELAREDFGYPTHAHWTLEKADCVVAVSALELRLASKLRDLTERGVVILNHINPDDFEQGVTAALGRESPSLVIALAAGFARKKGLHVLLEATRRLQAANFTVLLIGDTQLDDRAYMQGLRARYGRVLQMVEVGIVPHRRMLSYLRRADVFALPSLSEGAPNVLLEAMLAERAIVASDVGAVRDTIEDGLSGLVVRPGSIEDLAAALARLARDPELRCRLGRAAAERALSQFSPEKEAAAWDSVFQSIA